MDPDGERITNLMGEPSAGWLWIGSKQNRTRLNAQAAGLTLKGADPARSGADPELLGDLTPGRWALPARPSLRSISGLNPWTTQLLSLPTWRAPGPRTDALRSLASSSPAIRSAINVEGELNHWIFGNYLDREFWIRSHEC